MGVLLTPGSPRDPLRGGQGAGGRPSAQGDLGTGLSLCSPDFRVFEIEF